MAVDHINLACLDLNLLVAFDALVTELSVTRAAARVGLGQSAMSHNLARLRKMFGDELLTRTSDGMRPTPRALSLIEPVRDALAGIQALVVRHQDFKPETAERVFRIGLLDSMEILLIPALLAHLAQTAPGIRLHLRSVIDPAEVLASLDADQIDVVITIGAFPDGRAHHKRRLLLTGRFLCLFNAALVEASSPLSIDDYVRLPHVLTSLRQEERGVVDDALAAVGKQREIALITPRFLAVPYMVRDAPVIATMHGHIARQFSTMLGLSLSPPPVRLPDIPVQMLWHASYDCDAAHVWLRQTIVSVTAQVTKAAHGGDG